MDILKVLLDFVFKAGGLTAVLIVTNVFLISIWWGNQQKLDAILKNLDALTKENEEHRKLVAELTANKYIFDFIKENFSIYKNIKEIFDNSDISNIYDNITFQITYCQRQFIKIYGNGSHRDESEAVIRISIAFIIETLSKASNIDKYFSEIVISFIKFYDQKCKELTDDLEILANPISKASLLTKTFENIKTTANLMKIKTLDWRSKTKEEIVEQLNIFYNGIDVGSIKDEAVEKAKYKELLAGFKSSPN